MEGKGSKLVVRDKVEDFFVALDRIMVGMGEDTRVGSCFVSKCITWGPGGLAARLFLSFSFPSCMIVCS